MNSVVIVPPVYETDGTATNPANFIRREPHVLTEINPRSKSVLIPLHGPFYQRDFLVEHLDDNGVYTPLTIAERPTELQVDGYLALPYLSATYHTQQKAFGGVQITREFLSGMLFITYRSCGSEWTGNRAEVLQRLADSVYNPRIAEWDRIANLPCHFPPNDHFQEFDTLKGQEELIDAIDRIGVILTQPRPGSQILDNQKVLELMTAVARVERTQEDQQDQINQIKRFVQMPE
jgi:hypothetical protein